MSDLPKPSPAKPYQGQPQYQALNAYVRKLVEANITSSYRGNRFSHRPTVDVSSRGRVVVNGEYLEVAEFEVRPRHSGRDDGGAAQMEADTLALRICEALREAGWTVEANEERVGVRSRRTNLVYGPGIDAWALQLKAYRSKAQQREQDAKAKAAADGEALQTILDDHGVTGVSRYEVSQGKVTLSLAQVRQLMLKVAIDSFTAGSERTDLETYVERYKEGGS